MSDLGNKAQQLENSKDVSGEGNAERADLQGDKANIVKKVRHSAGLEISNNVRALQAEYNVSKSKSMNSKKSGSSGQGQGESGGSSQK